LVLVPETGIKTTKRLPSLPLAVTSTPPVDVRVRLTPIHVASVAKPGLMLGDMGLHLLPITITDVQGGARVPEATAKKTPAPPPKPIHTVRPSYPSEALQDGLQGQVVVEFALDSTGAPGDLKVVASSASQFDASALQAMAGWRFAPPAVAGRRYRQTFLFRLDAGLASSASVARSCLVTTGTHICRRAFDPEPGLQMLRPRH
jgi:TonB family protein